jgi:uncharacterized protein YjiS (DUF1127 family)
MTMITESGRIAAPIAPAGIFTALMGRTRAYFRNRRALADLSAMEDHLLRDIGLTRADVFQAAAAEIPADSIAALNRARARRSA